MSTSQASATTRTINSKYRAVICDFQYSQIYPRFANSVSRFTKDLLFVDDGDSSKLTFKSEMWGDVRRVILPLIVDNVS
jgi:hypothetical protein